MPADVADGDPELRLRAAVASPRTPSGVTASAATGLDISASSSIRGVAAALWAYTGSIAVAGTPAVSALRKNRRLRSVGTNNRVWLSSISA